MQAFEGGHSSEAGIGHPGAFWDVESANTPGAAAQSHPAYVCHLVVT